MKIAIIKTGATGDVVRTSVLLHLFKNDDIVWITANNNIPVLPQQRANLTICGIDNPAVHEVLNTKFDLVVSLDDDHKCAALATNIPTKEMFGAYLQDEKVVYTSSANEWFDMGLSSRFGKERADEIKWENKHSYQEILFRMLGHSFQGEEYIINEQIQYNDSKHVVGIEMRAGARWPTKMWDKYEALAEALHEKGYQTFFFKDRDTLQEYMQDIGNVSLFVGGDTLGMHIALAMKIPVCAIFTCTSAVEIYGYGRMNKIVSPYLKEAFYKTQYIPEAVESISLQEVLDATLKLDK